MKAVRITAVMAALAFAALGCERSTEGLDPWPASSNPIVFVDNYDLVFEAFEFSDIDAFSLEVEPDNVYLGEGVSLRVDVPAGDNGFAGGAFWSFEPRDFSGYDALTFQAKATRAERLNVAGFGNNNTGLSKYQAGRTAIDLTTTWQKYVIPIPLSEKLTVEDGFFWFAEAVAEGQPGYTVWFDDLRFEALAEGDVTPLQSSFRPESRCGFVGSTVDVAFARTIFDIQEAGETRRVLVEHFPGYFTFTSTDENVARQVKNELVIVGEGSAQITAMRGSEPVVGSLNINAVLPPDVRAPEPVQASGDVSALYSDAYPNRAVNAFKAPWDPSSVTELQIDGDFHLGYILPSNGFSAIEFTQPTLDATNLPFLHMDVWLPQGTEFGVKLVDFGADGAFAGGDDTEASLVFNEVDSSPTIQVGKVWNCLDIPLSDFTGLTSTGHLAQMILSAGVAANCVFVDNIYFHR